MLLLLLLDKMLGSLVVDKAVDKMVSDNLQGRLVEDKEMDMVVVVVAFAGLICWEKNNFLVFLDIHLGKMGVDKVEGTLKEQLPWSLDTQLGKQEVDMVEDTLEEVGPSSLEELAYSLLDKMVAYKAVDT